MAVAPAAMADMNGYDISNWQCGIDTATVPADFVIVGTTWGSGGVYGGCLSNGVNTDANRQLAGAINSGKETGIYHYAQRRQPGDRSPVLRRQCARIRAQERPDPRLGGAGQRRLGRQAVATQVGARGQATDGREPHHLHDGLRLLAGRRHVETELNCGIWIAQYAREHGHRLPDRPVEHRSARRGDEAIHVQRQLSAAGPDDST